MALLPGYKANFDTLLRAARAGDLALLECRSVARGEPVSVVCAANRLPEGAIEFVPLATLFDGNPYEHVLPPGSDPPLGPDAKIPHGG